MLEGKELEGKIGQDGAYEVDIDATGKIVVKAMYEVQGVKMEMSAVIELINILEKLAAKTSTQLDDKAIALIKSLLNK